MTIDFSHCGVAMKERTQCLFGDYCHHFPCITVVDGDGRLECGEVDGEGGTVRLVHLHFGY